MTAEEIELPATGQRLLFRACDQDAVVFESILPPQQRGLLLPEGAQQEQRFAVVSGTVAFFIAGTETILTAGGRVTVPRGTPCDYWNPGTESSHLVAEVRPPLDFERYARGATASLGVPARSSAI